MLNERNKLIENNKAFLHTNNNNNNYNGNLNNNISNNNNNNNINTTSSVNNLFGDKLIKSSSDSNMNFIKNGQLSPSTAQKLSQITLSKCLNNGNNNNSNNNTNNKTNGTGTVKTERLSPPVVNDLSMYR
jgi:hypothetical protein